MKEEKLVYIVVSHTKKPLKLNGKKVPNEFQIYEKVFLSDNLTDSMIASASLIIDIKNRSITKSKPEYESIGKELVINRYIGLYLLQIARFYKQEYGIIVEVMTNEI